MRAAAEAGIAGRGAMLCLGQLGAESVSYGDGLTGRVRALAPLGVDAAIDAAGTDEAVETCVALVADRRRVASIVAFRRGAELGITLLGGGPGADPGTAIRDAARLELVEQFRAGTLQVFVGQTFPLSDVASAHRAVLGGHTRGKIALLP